MRKRIKLKELSEEEVKKISKLRFDAVNETLRKRAMVIYAVNQSLLNNTSIASTIGVCIDNITDTVKGYNLYGIEYLTVNKCRKKTKLEDYSKELCAALDENPPRDLEDALNIVKNITNLKVSKTTMRKFLKKTDMDI